MKKGIYTLILGILLIGGFAVYKNQNSTAGTSTEPIKIGVISSETGDFAAVGSPFSQGVQFAYEQYKAKNPNANVELFREDDGSNSKKALSAYNKLSSLNKIDGLVNFSSPSINIIYDAVNKAGTPVIQLGEQDVTPTADVVYQIYPTQDVPEVATGEFVKNMSNGSDTVLFYTNDSTVIKFVDNIKKGYGKDFVEEFKLDLDQKEYKTVVAKAMSHNPKFAVVSGYTQNIGRVLQELMKYKDRPTIIFDLTYNGTELTGALPNLSVLDGSYVMSLTESLNKDFVNAYKARYNAEPNIFAGYGYDAFNTLMNGYDANNIKWQKNIGSQTIEGATGSISLDEEGLREPKFEMKMIKGGVPTTIK